ncbi:hypothetical protein F2Q70_00002810 [Brassica cretica]|uniref:Uncharacterized protein n=1 Tax=Brassica cretica TaxID=69181 RepID=A0A8S9IYE1_BRACR|nr:hypothetical protein F2Q68_00020637 [Brassica cretica]KAF2574422.1 hypothetical protein F2Q70_00002810 [Brassica cretica]
MQPLLLSHSETAVKLCREIPKTENLSLPLSLLCAVALYLPLLAVALPLSLSLSLSSPAPCGGGGGDQISSPLSLVARSRSRSRLRWSVLNPTFSHDFAYSFMLELGLSSPCLRASPMLFVTNARMLERSEW